MSGEAVAGQPCKLDILHTFVCKNSGHFWVVKVGFGQVGFGQL